jgi:hypothetical protein
MNQWQCARTNLKNRHSQATLDRPLCAKRAIRGCGFLGSAQPRRAENVRELL